jgi:nucleotide-binding universal stress UspA family protein
MARAANRSVAMNEIRSILLHQDASDESARRVHLAHRLAAAHGAQLEVLYAITPALLQYPMATSTDSQIAAMLMLSDAQTRELAKAAFEREVRGAGYTDVVWSDGNDDPVSNFKRHAFASDLMVLAQLETDNRLLAQVPVDFVASVLIETGKPALVLPGAFREGDIGRTVLIAWKPTPSSVRAVTAALPFLRRAERIHLATWEDSSGDDRNNPLPIERFLQRHGIAVTVHQGGRPPGDLGELLLALATDLHADVLVMGCYGHSRVREWILGGVTRSVLRAAKLPLLMAH